MKIRLDSHTLKLDNDFLIDARKKSSDIHPKGWIDPKAFNEMGEIWDKIRKEYMKDANINIEILLKNIIAEKYKLGPEKIESAEIIGGIPEHWKEMGKGSLKLR
jgi:hypothetical protein